MYDWYFGRNRTPSDIREARAQIALGFAELVLMVGVCVVLGGLWLGGVI